MLNELENKIRKAIPELNELGVGCELQRYSSEFVIIRTYQDGYTLLNKLTEVINHETKEILQCYDVIGKPIQLNHVLEYVKIITICRNFSDIGKDKRIMSQIIEYWNLKSNLLSEQSNELIKYINEL